MHGRGEGHRGAGRIFVEQVEHQLAGQPVGGVAGAIFAKPMLRSLKDRRDLVVAERIDGEQVHELRVYYGAERLASASIAPWRIWAAASASTFSARLARLTSASIIARSTAWVDQRSSHSSSG